MTDGMTDPVHTEIVVPRLGGSGQAQSGARRQIHPVVLNAVAQLGALRRLHSGT